MKNKLLISLWCAGCLACPVYAQKNIVKSAQKVVRVGAVRPEFAHVPGRVYEVDFFEDLLGRENEAVGRSILGRSLQNLSLEREFYGAARAARDNYIRSLLRIRWMNQWKVFTQNQAAVRKAVKGSLFDRRPIGYDKLFDFSSRWIFLGEMHGHTPIVEEVAGFVANFSRRHPNAPVYFATEFIDTRDDAGQERLFIRTPEELEAFRDNISADMFGPFQALLKQGVILVGLEDWQEFQYQAQQAFKEGYFDMRLPSDTEYEYRLARSLWGMEHRNQVWAKRLAFLRQTIGPEAYVFVYTGSGHVNRSLPGNLPFLLKKESSPVITLSVYEEYSLDFFLWDGYVKSPKKDLFNIPCHSRDCRHPQKLLMWHKKPEFTRLLGCDGRVWFF